MRRCDAHDHFALQLGCGWKDVRPHAEGVTVTLTNGSTHRFDAVILDIGFDVELLDRPELARYTPQINTWARHVTPEQDTQHPAPPRFPHLAPNFALQSADDQQTQALPRLHLFNWCAVMCHAALDSDIPGLGIGAARLAQALVSDLFVEDADQHWQQLLAHSEPELIVTRWHQT